MPKNAPTKDELRAAELMAERELLSTIREAVARSGLDRQEIARRMGIHKSGVSKVLNNQRNLTVKIAARLMRAAGERLIVSAVPVAAHGDCQADGYAALGAAVFVPKSATSTIKANAAKKMVPLSPKRADTIAA